MHAPAEAALAFGAGEAGRVIRRRAFQHDGQIRPAGRRGRARAAQPHLLLHRAGQDRAVAARQARQGLARLDDAGHADAVVEGLGQVAARPRQFGEARVRGHRAADPHAEGFRLFAGIDSDVDHHLLDRHHLAALAFRQEMRWPRSDDPRHARALGGAHVHPLGEQVVLPPAADGQKRQETLGRDVLHQETDLIHVPRQHHPRPLARQFAEHRAAAIRRERAVACQLAQENLPHLVLMAGNGMRFGEFAEEGQGLILHDRNRATQAAGFQASRCAQWRFRGNELTRRPSHARLVEAPIQVLEPLT